MDNSLRPSKPSSDRHENQPTHSAGVSRRGLLAIGGTAGLSALTGCSAGSSKTSGASTGTSTSHSATSSHNGVQLTLWNWVDKVYPVSAHEFNKTHPHIHIKPTTITAGPDGGYAKMRSAFKSDHAPDIAEVEYQQIPAFLLNNMLLKLNDYIDAEDEQKFIPAILEQATYQKGIYGVPHDAGAMALFYREDLFDKWNIDVPATWDQFADAAEKVRKKRPKARMCAFPPGSSSVFKALAWQAGAQWVTQHGDSWRVAVDDHPSLKVAKFWQNLLDEDLVKPEQVLTNGFFKDLLDDNLACFPAASWCSEGMRDKLHNKQKGKWRVAKLPQWNRGEYLSGNWGGSTLAIMKSSDHPKAAAKAALWMCINKKSLTAPIAKNDQFQLPTIKHHPQVTDAFNDTSFSEFFGGQDVLTVFEDAAAHVNKKWSESPVDAQTRDALNKYFADAINKGHGTLVAALKKAQSAAESAMKKAGLQVA